MNSGRSYPITTVLGLYNFAWTVLHLLVFPHWIVENQFRQCLISENCRADITFFPPVLSTVGLYSYSSFYTHTQKSKVYSSYFEPKNVQVHTLKQKFLTFILTLLILGGGSHDPRPPS